METRKTHNDMKCVQHRFDFFFFGMMLSVYAERTDKRKNECKFNENVHKLCNTATNDYFFDTASPFVIKDKNEINQTVVEWIKRFLLKR